VLAGNSLDGPIPGELGDVTTLLKLDLTGNKLSGELPLYVIQLKAKGCDMKLYGNDPGFFLPKDLSALDDSISQLDLSRCSLHGWAFSRAINCCDPSVYSCSSRLRRYPPQNTFEFARNYQARRERILWTHPQVVDAASGLEDFEQDRLRARLFGM